MTAIQKVKELYEKKAQNGLLDVRFTLSPLGKTTLENVCEEILKLEDAIEDGRWVELNFHDLRWKENPTND